MSPFLFLIAAEGLAGLMYNVVHLEEFHPFKFNEKSKFELLRFADTFSFLGIPVGPTLKEDQHGILF